MDTRDEAAMRSLIGPLGKSGNHSIRSATAIALGICRCRKAVDPLINMVLEEEEENPSIRGYSALAPESHCN